MRLRSTQKFSLHRRHPPAVEAFDNGKPFRVAADQLCGAGENASTFGRRRAAPESERLARAGDGVSDIINVAAGEIRETFAASWILAWHGAPGARSAKTAIDEVASGQAQSTGVVDIGEEAVGFCEHVSGSQ